jgi:hypothetical protein
MSAWPDWLKVIQLKPRFLFGLWLLGALILFLPGGIADQLGVTEIRKNFRGWIGLGTLAAFAFWWVQLIPRFQAKRGAKHFRERAFRSLASLSAEEWLLVAYCLNRGQQTITLEIGHRAAGALTAKGIFVMASGANNSLAWPYTMPSFLWDELRKNPQIIFNGIDSNDARLEAKFAEIERHIRRFDMPFF